MTKTLRFLIFTAILLAFNPLSHGAGMMGTAAGGGPGGCASAGPRGNGNCTPFPQGLQGTVRTYVRVVFSIDERFLGENKLQETMSYYSDYVKNGLNRMAAANPNGPQFQYLDFNEARQSDLWVNVLVEGETSRGEDEITGESWTHLNNTWCQVYATGLGYEHLFNFNTSTYDNPSNIPSAMFDQVTDKAYRFFAYGWSCN
jgi:hypothetical protein